MRTTFKLKLAGCSNGTDILYVKRSRQILISQVTTPLKFPFKSTNQVIQ